MGRLLVVAVFGLAACGRSGYERLDLLDVGDDDGGDAGDGGDSAGDGGGDAGPELIVEPALAGAPTRWNSYIRYLGPSLDVPAEACVENGVYRGCLHAGELRRVAVPGATSCAGLGVISVPAFFEWQCVETAAGAVFTTTRLAQGVGLRDLIDFETRTFRPIVVSVSEVGRATRVSAATVWWDNPIRELPGTPATTGRVAIEEPDTIYLVPQDVVVHGVDLRAHGVALVGAPGVRILPAQGTPPSSCVSLNAGDQTPTDRACVLHAEDVDRVWIEIDTSGVPPYPGMSLALDNTNRARVHRSHFGPSTDHGIQLRGAIGSRLTDVTVERGSSSALFSSSGNLFSNLRLAGADLYLFASDENVFDELTTFGGFAGINLNGSSSLNAFVRGLTFSHAAHGVQVAGSNNFANVFVGTTVAQTGLGGVGLWASDRTTLHLSAIVNSGEHGIDSTSPAATVSYLASGANAFAGVELQGGGGLAALRRSAEFGLEWPGDV